MNIASETQVAFRFGQSPLRPMDMDRVAIGHALIDNCSFHTACESIIAHAKSRGQPAYATTANAHHIVLLDRDPRLRQIYRHADLVVPDGCSLLFAARIYGRSLPERVTGVDMFQRLCGLAAENDLSVFLLGGRPGSAELAAGIMKRQFPGLRVNTYCPPYGFEKTARGLRETAKAVLAAKPDLLFVAFGAPKQEYWIYEHGLQLSIPVSVGVGGSFEMVAGVVPRAPMWVQSLACEWLYRLCREPRRMWRRYLIGNMQFGVIVARQSMRRAFLTAFFSLLNKNSFAAELHEPDLQYKLNVVASVMELMPPGIARPQRSDALAG